MVYKLSTRMLFCDWHMPNHLPEIKIDYDEYFEQIKRTGAQTLIFMAKTAHGACLFPTEVGITNKTMQGDLFGEISLLTKSAATATVRDNARVSVDSGRIAASLLSSTAPSEVPSFAVLCACAHER